MNTKFTGLPSLFHTIACRVIPSLIFAILYVQSCFPAGPYNFEETDKFCIVICGFSPATSTVEEQRESMYRQEPLLITESIFVNADTSLQPSLFPNCWISYSGTIRIVNLYCVGMYRPIYARELFNLIY